jgi:hypothetical protein
MANRAEVTPSAKTSPEPYAHRIVRDLRQRAADHAALLDRLRLAAHCAFVQEARMA